MDIALIIILILLILSLGIMMFAYFKTFYYGKNKTGPYDLPTSPAYEKQKDHMNNLIKELLDIPYEQIYILSKDKLKLSARYYHVDDNSPIQIQCHGYKGNGIRDFCGGNELARKLKHNTLIIDQRAHGNSHGHNITFGIKEKDDILCWLNYCVERFGKDKKIFLVGVSMGAASILMCGEDNLPRNVVALIADSPYSTPSDIINEVTKQMKLIPWLIYPFIYMSALLFAKVRLNKTSALKAIKNIKIPILIIHGEKDSLVPCDMSRKLKDANPQYVELHTFENADHGLSYIEDPIRYNQIVTEFLLKIEKA